MTNKEKIDKIQKWCNDNHRPQWNDEPPTSQNSMGNYDDVFEDGMQLGLHYAADDILNILKDI